MIIDFILDRKDGIPYDAKEFYDYVIGEESVFGLKRDISRALDSGTEKDVKKALCDYIIRQGYNKDICKYINSVSWLGEYDNEEVVNDIEDELQAKVKEVFKGMDLGALQKELSDAVAKACEDYLNGKLKESKKSSKSMKEDRTKNILDKVYDSLVKDEDYRIDQTLSLSDFENDDRFFIPASSYHKFPKKRPKTNSYTFDAYIMVNGEKREFGIVVVLPSDEHLDAQNRTFEEMRSYMLLVQEVFTYLPF